MTTHPGPGRPKMPEGQARTKLISIRLTPEEHKEFKNYCRICGDLEMATEIRRLIQKAVQA